MAPSGARGYLRRMEPTRQLFERRQADLLKVVFAMVMVAFSATFFTHSLPLALVCWAMAAFCVGLWLVRRIRYANRS
jgi:hypothetical protein